ncbi:sensor histidine kinase [Thermogemmatispora sp.]|uniref:sensor histidine kinase n=1 Tax=Thermogemmatispora sp. TaxID=1968838 RepID=UPI0035E449AD
MRATVRSLGAKLILAAGLSGVLCSGLFLVLSWPLLSFFSAHHTAFPRVWLALASLLLFTCAPSFLLFSFLVRRLVTLPLSELLSWVEQGLHLPLSLPPRTPSSTSTPSPAPLSPGDELAALSRAFQQLSSALAHQDAESRLLTRQLSDLLSMSDALISTLNLEHLLAEIVSRLGVIMQVRQVSLLLYGRDQPAPWAVALWSNDPPRTELLTGETFRQGQVRVYTDPRADITLAATTKMAALPRPTPPAPRRRLIRPPRLQAAVARVEPPHPRIPQEALRELDMLLARMAMQKQKIAYGEDVRAIYQERQERWARLALEAGYGAVIATPLLLQDETIGAIMLYSERPYQLTQRDTFLLSTAAIQAAMAIQDALLFAEVKEKNVALERANQLKSQFLATVTHELRAPLHSIISYGSLLVDGFVEGTLTPEQEEHIRFMIRRAEDLSHLVDDMLDLSKIEADRLEVRLEPLAIEGCLREVVDQLKPLAFARDLTLQLELPEELPRVLADGYRLRQVLVNMVSNAIKFTERGGITIRCSLLERYDMLRIAVHDSGIGISPAALEYIFEAFRQADSSTARKFGGTGLGLTIARKLVELQGGEVFVESMPGRGSIFSFVLPLAAHPKLQSRA